jgi:hypothetical protein
MVSVTVEAFQVCYYLQTLSVAKSMYCWGTSMSGKSVVARIVCVCSRLFKALSKLPLKCCCRCCCSRVSPELPVNLSKAFVVSQASPVECLDDVTVYNRRRFMIDRLRVCYSVTDDVAAVCVTDGVVIWLQHTHTFIYLFPGLCHQCAHSRRLYPSEFLKIT